LYVWNSMVFLSKVQAEFQASKAKPSTYIADTKV